MSYYLFILGALIAALILAWYRFCYAPYQLFKRIGIPHPPVTPFFGNTLEITKEVTFRLTHDKWIKKYGKVVGFYLGTKPSIAIADLDILKENTLTVSLIEKNLIHFEGLEESFRLGWH
jgi:cytochrome P450 family 3 subfamily A